MSIDTTKIIHAPVGGGRYTVTAPIVKEDYGLYLLIEGLELPSTYEVDFSNSENSGTSVTMIGNADGVLIPNQFIDSGKDVFAFLYHVGVDFGRTVYKFRIPNKLRPDRTDEQPTPEEQSVIDQAISALNTAVGQTAQDVIDADASAQSAQGYAKSAEGYAESASTSATEALASETTARSYANSASASATASAQSASQSAQIKTDVESMVDDAQASASASAQSATASANSASQASASAQSASSYATNAQGYASSAQTSAQTASTKATEASTSASTASAKATESAQSATNAQTYATQAESAKTASQTAQTASESARDSAITAQESAEDARDEAQSIVDGISGKVEQIDANTADIASLEDDRYKPYAVDSASGSIASFPDGADDIPLKSLVVDINPVQDLHGYDSPWVGGGGKNKLFLTATTTTINGVTFTVNDGIITANGTATADIVFEIWSKAQNGGNVLLPSGQYIVNGGANGGGTSTYRIGSNGFAWSGGTLKTETDSLTFTITENEAQTNIWIQVFNGTSLSNVVFKPMIRLASVTDATFAPYENICPISGWTEVDVEQRGVNVWDEEWEIGIINPDGTIGASTTRIVSKNFIPVVGGTEYSVSYPAIANVVGRGAFYDADENLVQYYGNFPASYTTANGRTYGTVTAPENAKYLKFGPSAQYGTTYNNSLSINYPSTDHDYHPYTGRSISIQLGQTVYGGKVDVVSGELVIDRAMVDLGTLNWDKNNSLNLFYTNIPDAKYAASAKGRPSICSALASAYNATWAGWSNFPDYSIAVGNNYATRFYNTTVKATEYTDVASFKQMLTDTNARLVYELAEPIEIQLSPNQINSLLGVNNIWADSGDTTAEYRADTKLFIERLTAPDSADMVADANITSGQYFMVGNSLYLATANIASGGQVIVGTNATRKSLAQALNEINS